MCRTVATRADFLVRGVVRCRRAFRGLKISSEEIGRNEHPHSARFFSDEFFCPSAKDVHQNLGRRTRTSCVQEARTTPRTRKTVRAATTLGGIAKSNRTDDVTAALSVCLSTGTSVTVVHLLKPLDCIKCHLAEHWCCCNNVLHREFWFTHKKNWSWNHVIKNCIPSCPQTETCSTTMSPSAEWLRLFLFVSIRIKMYDFYLKQVTARQTIIKLYINVFKVIKPQD